MLHLGDKFPAKGYVKDYRNLLVDNKTTHLWGRSGDNLMTHFQCEVYNLRNVKGRDLMSHILEGDILLCDIHRSTLDELWS